MTTLRSNRKTTEEWWRQLVSRKGNPHGLEMIPDSYTGTHKPAQYRCPIHGIMVTPFASAFSMRCKTCSYDSARKAARMTKARAQKKLDKAFPGKFQILSEPGEVSSTPDRRMRFLLRCNIHGIEFDRLLHKLISGASNCPECAEEKRRLARIRLMRERHELRAQRQRIYPD